MKTEFELLEDRLQADRTYKPCRVGTIRVFGKRKNVFKKKLPPCLHISGAFGEYFIDGKELRLLAENIIREFNK